MTVQTTAHDLLATTIDTDLGHLTEAFYEAALETYGDPELAAVVASTLVTEAFLDAAQPAHDVHAA